MFNKINPAALFDNQEVILKSTLSAFQQYTTYTGKVDDCTVLVTQDEEEGDFVSINATVGMFTLEMILGSEDSDSVALTPNSVFESQFPDSPAVFWDKNGYGRGEFKCDMSNHQLDLAGMDLGCYAKGLEYMSCAMEQATMVVQAILGRVESQEA